MMTNEMMMTLKMNRLETCDVLKAITSIMIDMKMEMDNEATSEDRRRILQTSIDHRWKPLHDMIEKQLDEFDAQ